jgi:hypothetical protein
MSVYDFMRAHPGLAAVAAAAMGPSTARVPAAVSPTAPHAAPAPKELTAAQREIVAEAETESRLRAAVQRQIERVRPGAASHFFEENINKHGIEIELRRNDGDSVELGLAKACAREVMRRYGTEKAAPLVQGVRDLKVGYPVNASRGRSSSAVRSGHVIAAAPRR